MSERVSELTYRKMDDNHEKKANRNVEERKLAQVQNDHVSK